jgi:hypothetical protein
MSASRETPSALAVSSEAEKADVLDELVAIDDELQDRAERVARSRLSDVETDGVASAVTAALLALDQEDLAANAGRTRYGYVEPTEAAWSLLEAAVESWLEDLTRRARLGLLDATRRLGLGIFEALKRVDQHTSNDDLLISWAPDFADEAADHVTQVLADAGIATPVPDTTACAPPPAVSTVACWSTSRRPTSTARSGCGIWIAPLCSSSWIG